MKIFCIGRNYSSHIKELNNVDTGTPVVFIKPETALIKGATVSIPPFTKDFHYEAELVVRFSKSGKDISRNSAWDMIDAITVGIDFTARDVQEKLKADGHPWELAKSFDESAAIGEWIEFDGKWHDITFSLSINDEEKQKGNTQNMISKLDMLISYISGYFTIQRGDLLFTGTPEGVGSLQKGDKLCGYLEDNKVLICTIC